VAQGCAILWGWALPAIVQVCLSRMALSTIDRLIISVYDGREEYRKMSAVKE